MRIAATARRVSGSAGPTSNSTVRIDRISSTAPEQADGQAGQRLQRAFAEHQRQHVGRPGAERHPHADLAGAQGDEVRHHAVDAGRGEHQGQRPEHAQQDHRRLARAFERCATSSIVRTLDNGRSGSTARSASRIAAAGAAAG